jgi:hypothetical protein
MQWRNLARLDPTTLEHIRRDAAAVRDALATNCVTTRGSIA